MRVHLTHTYHTLKPQCFFAHPLPSPIPHTTLALTGSHAHTFILRHIYRYICTSPFHLAPLFNISFYTAHAHTNTC